MMTTQLTYLREAVQQMKPGDRCEFSRDLLMFPVPPPWTPADWILEGIVGSAYEFSHYKKIETGNVIFRRWQEPLPPESGLRHYVSADKRDFFEECRPGLFQLKETFLCP